MPRPGGVRASRRRCRVAGAVAALLGVTAAACSPSTDGDRTSQSSEVPPPVRTLSALPAAPDEPPTGRLQAELRQSSRDVAGRRMQVWVTNGTEDAVRPRALVYRDSRFARPLRGTRLRPVPPGSERGFPLVLPRRPRCSGQSAGGDLVVHLDGERQVVPVEDPTDVAGRHASTRCLEQRVARVARLRWSDEVAPQGPGEGASGTLVLEIRPTGRPGPDLRVLRVGGTPLLGPVAASSWRVDRRVRGTDPVSQVPLEVRPVRCDGHAFAEAAGATAFRVGVELGGEEGSLLLRMSPEGTQQAQAYATEFCGRDGR